jgi:hypothetical protein
MSSNEYYAALASSLTATDNTLAGLYKSSADEQAAYDRQKQDELADWKTTFSQVIGDKSSLYAANPALEKSFQKAAALKTLVGAFGNIIDVAGLSAAKGAPTAKYIPQRTQTPAVEKDLALAQAAKAQEQSREAESVKAYREKLAKIYQLRPKPEKSDYTLNLIKSLEGRRATEFNALNAFNRDDENRKHQTKRDEENRKHQTNRDEENRKHQKYLKSLEKTTDQSKIWSVPIYNENGKISGYISLPKSLKNPTTVNAILSEIYANKAISEEARAKIKNMFATYGTFDSFTMMEAELGHLLKKYPDQMSIIYGMERQQGEKTNEAEQKTSVAPVFSPNSVKTFVNVPGATGANIKVPFAIGANVPDIPDIPDIPKHEHVKSGN